MNEHLIAWLFASILLILLAASGITHALIARRGTTPTLLNLRARVHAWWLMSAVLAAAFAVGRGGTGEPAVCHPARQHGGTAAARLYRRTAGH